MRKRFLITVAAMFLVGGCGGEKPRFSKEQLANMPFVCRDGLPEAAGGFSLAVAGQTITCDEVVNPLLEPLKELASGSDFEQFKKQARPTVEQVLNSRITNIVLYQQAKSDAPEQIDELLEKAVEAEVRKFLAEHGNDWAKAEEELRNRGMDWKSYREYQKKFILSQYYLYKEIPSNDLITHSQMVETYNRMKDEQFTNDASITFRLIDIDISEIDVNDPSITRQQQAKTLADNLIGRLRGGADFSEIAKQYSNDHRSQFGGLWKPVNPASLAAPYDVLAGEAARSQVGQIAGPIESGGHIFIMRLEEKKSQSAEPLESVQKKVEDKIIFERRKEAIDKITDNLGQKAAACEKEAFIEFCLQRIYVTDNM